MSEDLSAEGGLPAILEGTENNDVQKPAESEPEEQAPRTSNNVRFVTNEVANVQMAASFRFEEPEHVFAPSQEDIQAYRKWLGLDADEGAYMSWIAEEGLKTSLPNNVKMCTSSQGDVFFYDTSSKQASWEHPKEAAFRQLVQLQRGKQPGDLAATSSPAELVREHLRRIRRVQAYFETVNDVGNGGLEVGKVASCMKFLLKTELKGSEWERFMQETLVRATMDKYTSLQEADFVEVYCKCLQSSDVKDRFARQSELKILGGQWHLSDAGCDARLEAAGDVWREAPGASAAQSDALSAAALRAALPNAQADDATWQAMAADVLKLALGKATILDGLRDLMGSSDMRRKYADQVAGMCYLEGSWWKQVNMQEDVLVAVSSTFDMYVMDPGHLYIDENDIPLALQDLLSPSTSFSKWKLALKGCINAWSRNEKPKRSSVGELSFQEFLPLFEMVRNHPDIQLLQRPQMGLRFVGGHWWREMTAAALEQHLQQVVASSMQGPSGGGWHVGDRGVAAMLTVLFGPLLEKEISGCTGVGGGYHFAMRQIGMTWEAARAARRRGGAAGDCLSQVGEDGAQLQFEDVVDVCVNSCAAAAQVALAEGTPALVGGRMWIALRNGELAADAANHFQTFCGPVMAAEALAEGGLAGLWGTERSKLSVEDRDKLLAALLPAELAMYRHR
ncbi:hypothetical protein CYMTET_13651 [Cymbomonas tetramitiformis]|uniref:WW domain-containing protein n=1 Tax=Cymbomonas tetramitiformis TaxID=36881 RepID=A0AAE0GHN5_9CHLO|nr:hypothetical protein CYMTET_13651 [Cymbomonas tetramitiformis]